MCKLIRWVLFFLAVCSCQAPLFDTAPRSGNPYSAHPPVRPGESTDSLSMLPSLYATAVCYPDSVDWRAGEDGAAMLFLLREGKEVLRVPVSGRASAYRHRIMKGQLWTDYCEKGQTVVCCNGEERFRFAGEEVLGGFWVQDDRVYTLGQRAGGGGISFRIDGTECFSSQNGVLMNAADGGGWEGGAFSIDTTGIYYAYGVPVRKQEAVAWEYRIMKEDRVEKILPPSADCRVYDIRVWNGMVYRFEDRGGVLCLVKGETYLNLSFLPGEVPHYCKLVPAGDRMLLKGYSYRPHFTYWLRDQDDLVCAVSGGHAVSELAMDGDDYGYLLENDDGSVLGVYLGQEAVVLSKGRHVLTSSRCVQYRKQLFGAALTAVQGQRHLLVRDRDTLALRFNGYFTSIQID